MTRDPIQLFIAMAKKKPYLLDEQHDLTNEPKWLQDAAKNYWIQKRAEDFVAKFDDDLIFPNEEYRNLYPVYQFKESSMFIGKRFQYELETDEYFMLTDQKVLTKHSVLPVRRKDIEILVNQDYIGEMTRYNFKKFRDSN